MGEVMDILLTPEESEDARMKAELAVWRRHGDITEQIQAGNEAVLRAQVRKVVEWAQGMACAAAQANDMAASKMYEELWAALKAAGEGR